MKNTFNQGLFECVMGKHSYEVPNKDNPHILMCKYCMKKGHRKESDGYESWYDYDDKGNEIHWKDSNGYEIWLDNKGNWIHRKDSRGYERWSDYDDKGNEIHWKNSRGYERWLDNEENWVSKKPENWKYEK